MRDGDWKLIRFFEDGHEELYNLKNDPGELNNLANNPFYTMGKNQLRQQLQKWQEQTDDPLQ